MVAKIEPLMTVDDLAATPDDGNRYEVIEGELFVSRAPGLLHQLVTGSNDEEITAPFLPGFSCPLTKIFES